jgi:N-acetylmuramoyl-L-alanine amidase
MGAHQDNLAVLRLTSMPGCLIELGFISTPDEERYMNTSAATEQYARGIYNAFAAYKKRHGGNITIPYLPEPIEEKAPAKKPEVKPEEPQNVEPQAVVAPVETAPTSVTPEFPESPETPDASKPQGTKESPKASETPEPKQEPATPAVTPVAVASNAPIFKVQILVSSQKLKAGDKRLKGQTGVDSYVENGMTKYTVGASENYNEIYQLRKSLLDKFPEAFIIAFKNGQRMDVQQAIREFKNKRVK